MSELIENQLSPIARPVAVVKTNKVWPSDWLGQMKAAIVKHGGSMTERDGYCLWYFPDQTVKRQVFPIMSTDRWKIILPDGFEINMPELPGGGQTLVFPDGCFSHEIMEKYAHK